MAKGSETKLYAAAGILLVLGGAYFMQVKSQKAEAESHSISSVEAELPEIALSEEETSKITKIVLEKPAGDDEGAAQQKNVLQKVGDTWKLVEPVSAQANQKNVESLLKNLTKLSLKERIGKNEETYDQYEVSDDKAVHAAFYEGDRLVREVWAGKSGGRGQLARVDAADGVFVLDGYSSFLYGRETKNWRDLSILEIDKEEVAGIRVENEQGTFTFEKEGDEWSGKFKAEGSFSARPIEEFEAKKVEDLLGAYKKLSASDFGDGKSLAETGLDEPAARLVLTMADDEEVVVLFGKSAEGSAKWAKLPEGEQIYSISSWAADWAFADEEKFQASDEPGPGAGGPPGGMPPGMGQMPMGMPPGHP